MLENIRYKIGAYYLRKADEQLKERQFGKAFNNIKRAVAVVPPSKELTKFGQALANMAKN